MVPFDRRRPLKTAARTTRAACILSFLTVLPLLAALLWSAPSRAAAPQAGSAPAAPPAANAPATKPEVKPLWSELTAVQQDVLGPLAAQWSQFDSNHKAKWLEISKKYPSMPAEKQQKLKQNIAEWAKLTPEQHRLARESYAKAKKLDSEQKAAKWEQYQQLPDEQKKKLAEAAAAKKRIANLPSLQAKSKTVEPLKGAKKPLPAASAPIQPLPNAPAHAVPAGTMPVNNPQPAAPVAPDAPTTK